MKTGADRARHDTTVSLRMPLQTKALIERAAISVGKTFSAFVTESASHSATDALLDQCVFGLEGEQAAAFARMLDAPPPPTARLRALMRSEAPWEA